MVHAVGRRRSARLWAGQRHKLRREQEDITLSEHLILACLFEAVICHAKYGASAPLDEEKLSEIRIPPVAIAPWRWDGMRFFCGQGASFGISTLCVDRRQDGTPAEFLRPYVDNDWVYVGI